MQSTLRSSLGALALLVGFGGATNAQEDFKLLGAAEAPVEMTVYSDFECPACRNFALAVTPALVAEFIGTGFLRLRYVYFPLTTIHPNAAAAAKAAQCAGEAGLFWAYHDYLFVRQPEWRGETVPSSLWVVYAENLGLEKGEFARCFESKAALEAVEANWLEAVSAGATGTPTVVLNGQSLAELGSYEDLRARILEAIDAGRTGH
ncbi:MAG: thioredoxin domain-containing protein [Candidatus Palauibacterales bacterium]|nr:thioredoxin domain-containing protein [Candidatus Palauibacterales bacterium]